MSILSQVVKIILKVIDEKLKRKVRENVVNEKQYGFVKGKGRRNATLVMRTIIERAIENQKDLYLCFIDLEKAFDLVRHDHLMDTLKKCGVDGANVRKLVQLHW